MNTTLSECLVPQAKSKIKAGNGLDKGSYCFFTSSPIQSKYLDKYQYDSEALIFGTGGNASVHYCDKPFSTSTDCLVMYGKEDVNLKMIYYYLMGNMHLLQNGFKGAGLQHISKGYILNIPISLPAHKEQAEIVKTFDMITSVESLLNRKLVWMDEIVKSRFVEMFGDPDSNPKRWIKTSMGDYVTVLADFSANGSYAYLDSNVKMYDEPNYALMIRTTDLERQDFSHDVKYIDEHAYKILSKSKVFGGEIIMNKIGSAGKIYLMPYLNRPVSLGRNAFLFRYTDDINVVFLYHQLVSEYGTTEIMQHVRGAVTKTITKEGARSVRIIVPPIDLQNQFATFVEQVDKSKLVCTLLALKIDILQKKERIV